MRQRNKGLERRAFHGRTIRFVQRWRLAPLGKPYIGLDRNPSAYRIHTPPAADTDEVCAQASFVRLSLLSIENDAQSRAHSDLLSVYKSSAGLPHSRPQPDCLYPPNGSAESNTL